MCPTIPSLNNVCITIQREETRKKVMNSEVVPQESSALVADNNKKLIVDHLITTKRACV